MACAARKLTVCVVVAALTVLLFGCTEDKGDRASAPPSEPPTVAPSKLPPPTRTPDPGGCTRVESLAHLASGLRDRHTEVVAAFTVPLPDDQRRLGIAFVAAVRIGLAGRQADLALAASDAQVGGGKILTIGNAGDWFVWVPEGSGPERRYTENLATATTTRQARACLR